MEKQFTIPAAIKGNFYLFHVYDVKISFILIFLPCSLSTVSHFHDNETEMYVCLNAKQ